MTQRASLPRCWYQVFASIPLRVLLTIPFMLQLMGAIGIVSYLSAESGQQSVSELADKLMQQVLIRIQDRLNTYLQMPHYLTNLNRGAIEAGELSVEDFDQLEKHFFRQIKTFPSLSTLSFGNTRGEVIGVGRDRLGVVTTPGNLAMWEARGTAPRIRRFYQIDEQGNHLAVIHNTPNFDVRQTHWYKAAVARGKQTWSPIFPAINLPIAIVSAVVPVYQNHELKGILTSDLPLSDINLFLSSLNFSPAGQSLIIEKSGDVVATSTKEKPFITNVDGQRLIRLHAVHSKNELTRATTEEMLQRWHNLNQIQSSQRFNFALNHQRQFVQIAPYHDPYGLDWLIVVVIPESDFMAVIHANTQRTWILCGLTLLLAVGTGLLSAHWIATPIRRLQQAAVAIATGQLDYPVETSGVGEVASLTNAFQGMAHQLEMSFRSLQASEQRFEDLLSQVPVGISIFDATGNQILLNQVGASILGRENIPNLPLERRFQTDQIYQAGTNQLYPVEHLPVTRALRGETTSVDDIEIEVNGQRVALEVHAIPVFNQAGNVLYAINTFQDITKRRQAEQILTHYSKKLEQQIAERTEELQRSEARYRAIVEDQTELIARFLPDSTFLFVNNAYCRYFGLQPQEVIGKSYSPVIAPEDQERVNQLLHSMSADNPTVIIENRVLVNGSVRWTQWVNRMLCDHQGNISELQSVGRDITELKRTEAALRQSEERFRSAFEDAPIGMALVGFDGQLIRVNRSLCEILGYTQNELLTKTLQEITHPDDLAIDLDRVQTVLAGEIRTYQVQKRYFHQRGHVVWVLLNVSLVENSREDPIYFIAQIQDISTRYAIDQIKDEFISIVSHELRTPLTAIHGSLGILESGIYSNNPERFNYLIQIALNNSERLVRLVNDILDLERLESRKIELVIEACEVTALIQQAVEGVQMIAEPAKIHLDWTPLPVWVWAAPDAIVQTLTNLLSNAIKFSPADSTVCVKAEVVGAKEWGTQEVRENITPSPYILFSIQDQGAGIPDDQLETIFGRFQQVNVQDSRQKGGTGLGLAICKSIVQQHQGQIWAESLLGAGSTFYFTLPIQHEPI